MSLSFVRRAFLLGATSAYGELLIGGCKPTGGRPHHDGPSLRSSATTSAPNVWTSNGRYGVQSGDITPSTAVVWGRSNRPSRMIVEWECHSTCFEDAVRVTGPAVGPSSDFTGQIDLQGLPTNAKVYFRVGFEDLDPTAPIDWEDGTFRTAPVERRDICFVWSADTAGQGWGIDPDRGGMRIYEAMRLVRPDFFLHLGDRIYADNILQPEVRLPDGSIWRNLVTPAKSAVASTLDDYRGNFAYNLLDVNVRRFQREVPLFALWDDHEVRNNWYPGQVLDANGSESAPTIADLEARARQAMLEYTPMRRKGPGVTRRFQRVSYGPSVDLFLLDGRSFRGPNSVNRQRQRSGDTAFLGAEQLDWLKGALLSSTATWKVLAIDMPLGVVVPDATLNDGSVTQDGWGNGDGPPLGRELEIADLLAFIKRARVRNALWIAADVHYAAAHYYDPQTAVFNDFNPFWEFVAGPLHAGSFPAYALDPTFGPNARYMSSHAGVRVGAPPTDGLQFFGTTRIDGRTEKLTMQLCDGKGLPVYEVTLTPA